MTQLLEYLKMAIDNIRGNKGRSFLTMLGIIIGIGSVILIMSIGQGVKSGLEEELSALGGGQIYVYVYDSSFEGADITPEDMEAIEKNIDHVKGVTPYFNRGGNLQTGKGQFDLFAVFGSDALQYVITQPIKEGRNISKADVENGSLVAVLSQTDAVKLFGTYDVVGLTVEITLNNITKEVMIVGIKESIENGTFTTYTTGNVDFDMPYTALEHFGYKSDEFDSVYIMAEGSDYASDVANESLDLLYARRQVSPEDEDLFMVTDISSQLDSINSVLDMVTSFIALVAGISLLVGGIGVMNIMLVSVTERTREIGIRKALGARTGSILMQFLSEAAIITLIGGIIGILIGVGGGLLVASLSGGMISAKISFSTVFLAVLFSSGVGLFFGIYPARRAAKLSPIEALRRN